MINSTIAIIVFGGSQMGKSTFVNMACGQKVAATGDGYGESTTKQVRAYKSRLGLLVDCPGYDDSDLEINIEDLAQHVAIVLIEIGATSVKFLVFESLTDGAIQLQKSILEMINAFGVMCKSSVVVVASKCDLVSAKVVEHRVTNIRKYMRIAEVGDLLVQWKSENINEADYEKQFNHIEDTLASVRPISLKEIDILSDRIERKAAELFDSQPRTKEVSFEESYAVDYQTMECHTEPYIDIKIETLLDTRMRHCPTGTIITGVLTLGIVTLGQYLSHSEFPEVKFREIKKEVTRSKTEYRTVNKEVPIDIQSIDCFYKRARSVVVKCARNQLKNKQG